MLRMLLAGGILLLFRIPSEDGGAPVVCRGFFVFRVGRCGGGVRLAGLAWGGVRGSLRRVLRIGLPSSVLGCVCSLFRGR